MSDLTDQALALGFSQAVVCTDLALTCHAELRAYCGPELCPTWGQNWVCPPGSGTLEHCQARVDQFHQGILLRSVTELVPPTPADVYQRLVAAHNQRVHAFVEQIRAQTTSLLPLSTGGCGLCEQCTYPAPCAHPDIKMESLSAYGIDVGAICASAGLPFSFRDDIVYLTALVLLG